VGDSINWVVLCFGSSFRKISLHIQGSGLRIVGVKWLPAAELTQKWHLGAHSRTKDDDCECVAKLTSLAHTILAITHTHTQLVTNQLWPGQKLQRATAYNQLWPAPQRMFRTSLRFAATDGFIPLSLFSGHWTRHKRWPDGHKFWPRRVHQSFVGHFSAL